MSNGVAALKVEEKRGGRRKGRKSAQTESAPGNVKWAEEILESTYHSMKPFVHIGTGTITLEGLTPIVGVHKFSCSHANIFLYVYPSGLAILRDESKRLPLW